VVLAAHLDEGHGGVVRLVLENELRSALPAGAHDFL